MIVLTPSTLATLCCVALISGQAQTQVTQPSYFIDEGPTAVSTPGLYSGFASGDLNGNGRDDLVLVIGSAIITMMSTAGGDVGTPIFTPVSPGIGASSSSIFMPTLADFNNDGILDLVAIDGNSNRQRLFLGNGFGGFFHHSDLPAVPLNNANYRLADIDRDGVPEIVAPSPWTPFTGMDLYVFRYGQATGTFSQVAQLSTTILYPQFADVDGDGNLDMIGKPFAAHAEVLVSLGDGTFSGFAPPQSIPAPIPASMQNNTSAIYARDVDGDGKADAVFNVTLGWSTPWGAVWPTEVIVGVDLMGSPQWTQTPSPGILGWQTGNNPLHFTDFNGDGMLDIVGSQTHPFTIPNVSPRTRVGLLLGDGTGGFYPSMVIDVPQHPFGWSSENTIIADLDGDGDKDFIMMEDVNFGGFRRFRNMSRFGPGCSNAPFGAPIMSSNLLTPGNVGFQMRMGNAPPFSPCILAVSRGGFLGNNGACQIGVDFSPQNLILPLGSIGISMTDAFGFVAINLPIPPDPGLIGLTLFAQWGVVDPFAPGGIALTSAGTFIIW